jgi:predicted nucleic-acid-binding protein
MAAMSDHRWIDANVVVRFLTDDPKEMADRSELLLQQADRGEVILRFAMLVVAEVVWVLGSFYKWSRSEIAIGLSQFLIREGLEVEDQALVLASLQLMSSANVSFVDAYLAESARRAGEPVVSFDRNFSPLNVQWLEPGQAK